MNTDGLFDTPPAGPRRAVYSTPRRRRPSRTGLGCLGISVIIAIIASLIGFWIYHVSFSTEHHETFTVTRLDDQAGGSSHKYLVFGRLPNGTAKVYEDTDAPLHGKFNSSDLFAQLQVGKTYDCDLNGYRSHLGSSYQNLLSCTQVQPG